VPEFSAGSTALSGDTARKNSDNPQRLANQSGIIGASLIFSLAYTKM
jgi:hypothetical protein